MKLTILFLFAFSLCLVSRQPLSKATLADTLRRWLAAG
jgi:hypothetical protein